MSQQKHICVDPSVYGSLPPETTFEEGRAILLCKYSEDELDHQIRETLQKHLAHCDGCNEVLQDLNDEQSVDHSAGTVVHASCPSSSNLHAYVWNEHELKGEERKRIRAHLEECPLCSDEASWHRQISDAEPVESNKSIWFRYGSIAAALFFMALSIFLVMDRISARNTEAKLRSVAEIKPPEMLNYEDLRTTSVSLPEEMNGVYEQGVRALKNGSYQEAIRHFELVTNAHPDHSASVFLLGYSYYHMNELQRAFEICNRAERMSPHSLERCLSLVNIALKAGHYRRAMEEISGLHHAAPEHPEIKRTYERIKEISSGHFLKL